MRTDRTHRTTSMTYPPRSKYSSSTQVRHPLRMPLSCFASYQSQNLCSRLFVSSQQTLPFRTPSPRRCSNFNFVRSSFVHTLLLCAVFQFVSRDCSANVRGHTFSVGGDVLQAYIPDAFTVSRYRCLLIPYAFFPSFLIASLVLSFGSCIREENE
jgi:hypothetical protein